MAKKKYDFGSEDWDDERDYKKVSKKKMKPRDESVSRDWRYNPNKDYYSEGYEIEDEYDYR